MTLKGIPRPDWVREKISLSNKGKPKSDKHKEHISSSLKGRKRSEESRIKQGLTIKGHIGFNKGKKQSEEHNRKIGNYRKGKHLSEESRLKVSLANRGNKNPSWQGGKSFERYNLDWTKTLRQSIRERDNYTCRICGKKQECKEFAVHHIDYDKKNCNPNNLITLCNSCHIKTNHKRKYWKDYFTN